MTVLRLLRQGTQALVTGTSNAQVARVGVQALVQSQQPKAQVARVGLMALVKVPAATTGPTFTTYDGAAEQAFTIEGRWDGSAIQPLPIEGRWDGTSIVPLS